MTINDLLYLDATSREYGSLPWADPLTEEDALQEAQVVDIRFDALADVVAILFELRQALQLQGANTGVLVARGVRQLAWSSPGTDTALTAWSVGSSVPRVTDQLFGLSLVMWPHPGSRLMLTAASAAFFLGDVPGLPDAPPDYSDGDRRAISAQLAGWDSPFEPVSASFIELKDTTGDQLHERTRDHRGD